MSIETTPAGRDLSDEPEPLAPGSWMTILGLVVAILGPLFGFLGGSVSGGVVDATSRLALWLMAGLVIGGLGVLCAFIGGLRWWRHAHP